MDPGCVMHITQSPLVVSFDRYSGSMFGPKTMVLFLFFIFSLVYNQLGVQSAIMRQIKAEKAKVGVTRLRNLLDPLPRLSSTILSHYGRKNKWTSWVTCRQIYN